jgi:hypothetical protein
MPAPTSSSTWTTISQKLFEMEQPDAQTDDNQLAGPGAFGFRIAPVRNWLALPQPERLCDVGHLSA